MKRDILLYPDPTLKLVSQPYSTDGKSEGDWVNDPKGLVDDLIETMKANGGAGLSAIQVGIPVRIFVARDEDGKDLVFVNPSWGLPAVAFARDQLSKEVVKEGCLSFPGFFAQASRWNSVEATYQDLAGIEYTKTFEGLVAQVIQHECEHLDGNLMSDSLGFTQTNKLKMHMKQYARRPQETVLKGFGLDPRQFRNMQRPTGARRTS